jgi:excisionase family DNA binding protein
MKSLLDVEAVATRLNVRQSWVYAQVEANRLAHIKVGRYLRFDPDAIEAYIAAQTAGGER